MNKRECLFCQSTELSKEHIYSKWIFNLLEIEDSIFTPSFHILERSNSNDYADQLFNNSSDDRKIRFNDFTVKQVCIKCNNGWMSDIEQKVKVIFDNLFSKRLELENLEPENAFVLSQWVVLKIILISTTSNQKLFFSKMIYEFIQKGIIPEGFIIEATKLNYKKLNYMIGGPVVRKSFDITRDQLDYAASNFFKAALQIGNFAFRISYLRTEIPVFRKQIGKRVLVLFPFMMKMPFEQGDIEKVESNEKLELPFFCSQIALQG
ncbi:MAG: hypothetical protein K9G31_03190 [Crocinitomicaceae bacterium]|jgi:hypothetical protein|nr:hypothetical protein [Crocinitomicaceae bacterium]MCF8444767.1 hypothetical protein [Crocinitomicaceae bacterium]